MLMKTTLKVLEVASRFGGFREYEKEEGQTPECGIQSWNKQVRRMMSGIAICESSKCEVD